MSASISHRVHEAKARFTMKTGDYPTDIFLGPSEYRELNELIRGDPTYANMETSVAHKEFAGMRVIGLMSDGCRAGISTADNE
jgi:hypothetical protein